MSEKDQIFVLAGNHDEFDHYINSLSVRDPRDFIYIDSHNSVRGRTINQLVRVGTWYRRSDILEISAAMEPNMEPNCNIQNWIPTGSKADSKKKTLVLDFDGVIHSYSSGWKGPDIIPDPPVPGAIPFIIEALGIFDIHIFSSRSAYAVGIPAMRRWLKEQFCALGYSDGYTDTIVALLKWPTTKPPAHLTIDDRALTFIGEWPSIDSLLEFKPWHQKKENNQK